MGLLNRAGFEAVSDPAGGGNPPLPSDIPESIKTKILQYQGGSPFYGVVFEVPEGNGGEQFEVRLAYSTAFFGVVISLPPRRMLLLFPKSMDSELVVHRLSKSLGIVPLTVFEADNPDQAAAQILNFIDGPGLNTQGDHGSTRGAAEGPPVKQ